MISIYDCSIDGCIRPAESGGMLCATHAREARKAAAPKAKPARKARISKQSDPERHNLYMAVRTLYLVQFPNCAICEANGIEKKAEDLHHRKGKQGDLLFDPRFFIGLCRVHHEWVHENPVDAIEHGWSLSRHQTEAI